MALPSAPAVSRCTSPSGVPPAAARAAEAAQAPATGAQIAGRSAVTQGSVPLLGSSPITSAALSSTRELVSSKAAAAGRSVASVFQVEVSSTGKNSTNESSHSTLCGAGQSVDLPADAGVSGASEGGVRLQSSTDAACILSGGETGNRTLFDASPAPAGAALSSAQVHPEVVKTETARPADGQQEHPSECERFLVQVVPSLTGFACAAHAAVRSLAADNVNSSTEEISISAKGVGAGAPGEVCFLTEDVALGSATAPSQRSLTPAADHKDVAPAALDKTANSAEGEGRKGACTTEGTSSSGILVSTSGSTSPRTPSTAPSAEPSPSLSLSQPSPAMLIRSKQAALPPPITDCCFKGDVSSNRSITKSDDPGNTRTNGSEEHPRVGGVEEEQTLLKCVDDRKKSQHQYEENALDGQAGKAPPTWGMAETSAGADNGVTSASPSTAADGSSAGSNRSKEQIVGTEIAQNNTAVTDVTNSLQEGEPRLCANPPTASGRRPDTSGEAVMAAARQETDACGAQGAPVQDGMTGAAKDKSVRLASHSPSEPEEMEAESGNRQVPAVGETPAAQETSVPQESSEPVPLQQRTDINNNDTRIETTPGQPVEKQARVQSMEEETGENSRFVGAASFLQKLQQQWETSAESDCHSLLSQLSIPLPAREKLLQNSVPCVRNSRGAEEVGGSSFLPTAVAARSLSLTPVPPSTAGASPGASTARSNNSSIKHAPCDSKLAAAQDEDAVVTVCPLEPPMLCEQASSPVRQRSAAIQSGSTGRRGVQQQQLEMLLRGRNEPAAGGSCGAHDCHDAISCGTMAPAAGRDHPREAGARAGCVRGTPAGADAPPREASSDLVAAAAAQVLQQQLRQQLQQQQQQLYHQPEARLQDVHPHERQQHVRAPENWTRCGAAAALEAVLSESNGFSGEGRRAADEESVNIRRWFDSFGIAGRRAETAVAAVVKRAVDLQRRLATLLTVTLRQQLNQRLLVLALAILLEKHRREPVRCEEMLREQQRLLRVLETQQQQALADLPHLYGDLPEAQQLQQQLQQLREAEWQLRTGGDRLAAARTATAAAAEQRPCHRVNRAAELGAFSSSHAHRLPTISTRMARAPAAAAAAVEGSTHVYHLSSPAPCTSAVAEGGGARWTVSKQSQADGTGRMTNADGRPDMSLLCSTAGTPGDGVFTAARSTTPRAKYLDGLTSGSVAESVAKHSGNAEARGDPATTTALRAPGRHSRQTNSSCVWEDSEPPLEDKLASENEGGARPQAQQPMVERFLAKQIERRLATGLSSTQNAASTSCGPPRAAQAAGMLEAAGAAAGTAKDSWRTGSNVGNFEDSEAAAARGRPPRSSAAPATPAPPPRVSACNISSRPDTLSDQCDRSLSGRPAAATEGGRSNASAAVLRSTGAAGVDACSSRSMETAANGAAAQSGKGHLLPVTRSQAMPLQGSPAESSPAASSSSFPPSSGSDTAVSGSFTSVYSRGSNARHQNDPYPHNVMIQLIQPLPTGIKLELKSHRPASLGSAHGVSALGASSNSVSSLSAAAVELPAPREYALRVSLTRHETKYCSFHSLHGILPAYNEAVRLRNKFAGLPFVLPTMTLQELHQRKEQLDAGRPLPGHGPHEAFMTVQERITYYKQTGMSNSNFAKVENTSLGASTTSVCYSPRSASPASSVAPPAGRSSQVASPLAPGAATAGSSSVVKPRNFRSSSASTPPGVDVAAAASAETDEEESGGPGIRRVSAEEEQQLQDETKSCIGRGGYSSGVKRGRDPSVLGSGQQEDRCSWSSTSSHVVTVHHQQQDGTRVVTTSKSAQVSKPVARAGKSLAAVSCRPPEEGGESGASQDGKMQLRSRTTSSSGSRSEGTTISTVTETSLKELSGAAEYRDGGEKRRKIANESDDAIQCFLERGCFSKSSNSDPDEGVCSSSQTNDPAGYTMVGGDASAAQTRVPGANSDRPLAGSMAEDCSGADLKRILARNGGSRRNDSGGRGNARCPWEELLCWESPPYTQQSPGETTAVEGQSVMDNGLSTTGDVELLTQELRTDSALSSLLDEEVLKHQRGGSKQSPRRTVAAFMSTRRGTVVGDDWLPSLHAGDRRLSDGQAGLGGGESTEEGRRPQFRGLQALSAGSSNSSTCRKINDGEASGLLGLAGVNFRRESTSVEYGEDTGDIRDLFDTSAGRNSNSALTPEAGKVKEYVQDGDRVQKNKKVEGQKLKSAHHTEGGAGGANESVQEEKNGIGEQEVDVNEEEARHLSELLLGSGMLGNMSSCNEEAERKPVGREQTRPAQGSGGQSRTDDLFAPSTQRERQQVQETPGARGGNLFPHTKGSGADTPADACVSRRSSRSD